MDRPEPTVQTLNTPPVLILAGGRGMRLRPLTAAVPKVLLPVRGRPFIDHVVGAITAQGFCDLVVSVGWQGRLVEQHLADGRGHGASVRYVREDRPLGTGGAVRHALDSLPETFVLTFGDVLNRASLLQMLAEHRSQGHGATLAAAFVEDRSRYGSIVLEADRFITIREKLDAGPGVVFAGTCILDRTFVLRATAEAFALTDLFQRHPSAVGSVPVERGFVDMGTHEALGLLNDGDDNEVIDLGAIESVPTRSSIVSDAAHR
jgi:NDP-sugar pyrophosphorylase family protein